VLVDLLNDIFVVDITSSDNNKIVTKVVSTMEISEVVDTDVLDEISVTLGWLTEHVISE
jgi:hypothetical protein